VIRIWIYCSFFFLSFVLKAEEIALFMPAPASGAEMSLETRSRFFLQLNKFLDWITSLQNFSYEKASFIKELTQPPECLIEFEKKHGFFSKDVPLVGQYTPLKSDLKFVEKILSEVDALALDRETRLFYIQEILSKVLAYRHLEEGDQIMIPDFDHPNRSSMYRLEVVFDLGLSMPAYGFTSKDKAKPSLLIYRGTHFDLTHKSGVASIIADLDLYGPGYTAFFKIENQLKSYLLKQQLKNKTTVVLGYSLGGALSLYTGIFFKEFIDVAHSCAFNPPGVQKKLMKLCEKDHRLNNFQVYINNSDPVSKWGYLIGNVDILTLDTRMGPLMAHTMLMSSQRDLDFFKCNLKEENKRHLYIFQLED
jgi:hypothetical protein